MRWASLLVELCLAVALAVAFGAVLAQGSRAGRVAFRAMVTGAGAGLGAAIGTVGLGINRAWLMDAWHVDAVTQGLKGLILAGLLASVRVTRQATDEWTTVRAVGPFFRLACAAALVVAVSAGDLVVFWLALDLATAALVLAVAVGGRWETRERLVRRMVQVWLPSSLLLVLGIVLITATAGQTRLTDLEALVPEMRTRPVVVMGLALALGSVMARAVRLVALLR